MSERPWFKGRNPETYIGSLEEARKEEDFDIDEKNRAFGRTALHYACREGKLQVVRELIENGANPNVKNKNSWTPLHDACFCGFLEVCKVLIDNGADVNKTTRFGSTPLHLAARQGDDEVIRLLISSGAFVDAQNRGGQTPLVKACQAGNELAALALIELGCSISVADESDLLALHYASNKGLVEVVKVLVERDESILSFPDAHFNTSLHYACYKKRKDVIGVLVRHGANVNAQNKIGETPVHISCKLDETETVEKLMQYGGRLDIKDMKGRTALSFCNEYARRILLKKEREDRNARAVTDQLDKLSFHNNDT